MSELKNIGLTAREDVAMRLAERIYTAEKGKQTVIANDPRKYWLTLYAQCFDVVTGQTAAKAIKENPQDA